MIIYFILTFVLSLVHEAGWLGYIYGVSNRKLFMTLLGNAWILITGTMATYLVVNNILNLIAVVAGGSIGTVLLWPLIRRANHKSSNVKKEERSDVNIR